MLNSQDFNHFDYNPTDLQIDRSLFNMDHSVKFSCNVGDVIPFDVIECLPGDTWTIDTSKVIRLQPLVAPIMDEVILDTYYFFVPMRLVWNHAKEFFGENNSSPWAPATTYSIPQLKCPINNDDLTDIDTNTWDVGTIADYMGIPPKTSCSVSALPFRAYALICDQWFRSESVMNPVNVHVNDSDLYGTNGSDQTTDIEKGGKPFVACKYFDYFTSVLPSPQRGDPSKVFPSDAYAPVFALENSEISKIGISNPVSAGNYKYPKYAPLKFSISDGALQNPKFKDTETIRGLVNNASLGTYSTSNTGLDAITPYYPNNLFAKLDNASFYINDLRTAFAVQRYLEKSARFGGRYIEFVKGFFGVTSPDARLQRTEYLGGSRLSLNINQVTQNSATEENTTPLGNVAGMSVTGDINSDVQYSCYEHGYIIGCSVLRYHHSYQQGINKMWLRKNFEEFYLPTFAFLGEEPVYETEIYNNFEDGQSFNVFGYQERWSSYRYMPNRVAGMMRTVSNTSLDVWHLGDYYASTPTLTPEWLREDKSMLDRCLAVTSEVADQCICDFYIKAKAARAMPLYSIPGLIDHY